MRRLLLSSTALLLISPAVAQGVLQSGTVTTGHITTWAGSGLIKDGGSVTANDTLAGASATSIASSSTYYCSPSGCASGQAIAALVPFTGTLANLNVSVATAPSSGQTVTATLMTGTYGALIATSITCQIAGTATFCQDLTHEVNLVAGQAWAIRLVTSSGATSTAGESFGVQFISSTLPSPTSPYVLQSGQITSGHFAGWVTDGVIGDIGGGPNGVLGPNSSVMGNLVCWGNTGGTLLSDCGYNFGSPPPMGSVTPNTGAFTSLTGSIVASGAPPVSSPWNFIVTESYTAGSGNFYIPFVIQDVMENGGTGERVSLYVNQITGNGAATQFYAGAQINAVLCGTQNGGQFCGGQGDGGSGSAVALNPYVLVYAGIGSGAEAVAVEFDTDIRDTSGNLVRKVGVQAVDVAASRGSGSAIDAAYLVGTQNGAIGYNVGLQFGEASTGNFGVKSGGTLIATSIGASSAKYNFGSFIDFSNSTCTNFQFYGANGGNWLVDCAGNLVASGMELSKTATGAALDLVVSNIGTSSYAGIELDAQNSGGSTLGWLLSSRGAGNGTLQFYSDTAVGGSYTLFATLTPGGGMQLGAPTGSDEGASTINTAGSIYVNGDKAATLVATQTLTNKTIAFASNTLTGVAPLASPTFSGTVIIPGYAISGLPTCNGGAEGAIAYVTNGQTSPSFLGTVSSTGAVIAPVFCNGSAWVYG